MNALITTDSNHLTASSSASWSGPSNSVSGHVLSILFMVCCWSLLHVGNLARCNLCGFTWQGPWPVPHSTGSVTPTCTRLGRCWLCHLARGIQLQEGDHHNDVKTLLWDRKIHIGVTVAALSALVVVPILSTCLYLRTLYAALDFFVIEKRSTMTSDNYATSTFISATHCLLCWTSFCRAMMDSSWLSSPASRRLSNSSSSFSWSSCCIRACHSRNPQSSPSPASSLSILMSQTENCCVHFFWIKFPQK